MDPKTKDSILITVGMSLISFLIFRHAFIGVIPVSIRNLLENLFLGIYTYVVNCNEYMMTPNGALVIISFILIGMCTCLGLVCIVSIGMRG
jgi:hypothetical protein